MLNMIGVPGALGSFLLDQSADFWQARVKSTAESLDRMCMVTSMSVPDREITKNLTNKPTPYEDRAHSLS